MGESSLTSHLPTGTIAYKEANRRSTIDLSLTTIGPADRLISCDIDEDVNHDSDHLIFTLLDLAVAQLQSKARLNWKAIDEGTFIETLRQRLPPIWRPRTKTALDTYRVSKTLSATKTRLFTILIVFWLH